MARKSVTLAPIATEIMVIEFERVANERDALESALTFRKKDVEILENLVRVFRQEIDKLNRHVADIEHENEALKKRLDSLCTCNEVKPIKVKTKIPNETKLRTVTPDYYSGFGHEIHASSQRQ